jgi:tetratricopeptide (TPR) repeat protein
VVLKALEKKPEDRYQTGGEFAAALQAALPATDATTPAKTLTLPAPAVPNALPPPPPRQPADIVIVAPRQMNDGARAFWRLVAFAGVIALIAFAATALFEKIKAREVTAAVPAQVKGMPAPASQAAGAEIAVDAPKPPPVSPPTNTVVAANAAPVIVERTATTTTSSPALMPPSNTTAVATYTTPLETQHPAPPPTMTVPVSRPTPRDIAPPRSPSLHPADLAEGDRRRRQALAFSNAHQWSSAVTAWRQFINDYSGVNQLADHAAYYNLGVAYESLRQWPEAVDAFERAARADMTGSDTNNLLRLARCYGKLGRWKEAATTYERVLRIDPANDIAKRSLLFALQQEPRMQ